MDKYLFNGNNTMEIDLKKIYRTGMLFIDIISENLPYSIVYCAGWTSLVRHSIFPSGCKCWSFFFFYWYYNPLWVCILQPSRGAIASLRTRFVDHTQRRATVGTTPLDEWSVRRRDLYLTTHNTHNRQTSMPPVGFEPTIAAGKRP